MHLSFLLLSPPFTLARSPTVSRCLCPLVACAWCWPFLLYMCFSILCKNIWDEYNCYMGKIWWFSLHPEAMSAERMRVCVSVWLTSLMSACCCHLHAHWAPSPLLACHLLQWEHMHNVCMCIQYVHERDSVSLWACTHGWSWMASVHWTGCCCPILY